MTHTISHYLYTVNIYMKMGGEENEQEYESHDLVKIKKFFDTIKGEKWESEIDFCLSMTEVYCCGYEVPIDKAAWSDKNDFTNIYNFIKEQEIRDTWIEKHLKGVENGEV